MIKKVLKTFAVFCFIGLIAVQFIRPNRNNPSIDKSKTIQGSIGVPDGVEAVFKRSCNDCHSYDTKYPWYSNISPISWKIVQHIEEGRDELNFSIWADYSNKKQRRKLKEICREVTSRNMPHNQYTWLHWDAGLSDRDITLLCDWTAVKREKLNSE